MSRYSRTKGATFERAVANRMREVWPDAKRGFQSRGAEAPDVDGTPWWVECKADEKIAPRAALSQGRRDTDGRPVVVVLKRLRKPWVVCVPFNDGGSSLGPFSVVVRGKRPRIPWDVVWAGEAVLVREERADAVPAYAVTLFDTWLAVEGEREAA